MVRAKPEQIRLILKTNRINILQLSKKTGLTPQAIHNALKGKPVGGKFIGNLLNYSGWDFSDLFYFDPNEGRNNREIEEESERVLRNL